MNRKFLNTDKDLIPSQVWVPRGQQDTMQGKRRRWGHPSPRGQLNSKQENKTKPCFPAEVACRQRSRAALFIPLVLCGHTSRADRSASRSSLQPFSTNWP